MIIINNLNWQLEISYQEHINWDETGQYKDLKYKN